MALRKYRPMLAGPMLLIVSERKFSENVYCELVLCEVDPVMSTFVTLNGVKEKVLE